MLSRLLRLCIYLSIIVLLISCTPQNNYIEEESYIPNKNWTVMVYLGGDNDLEYDLIRNVKQIKESYNGGCNILLFIDRSENYSLNSSVLGENFSGVGIYQVIKNGLTQINNDLLFHDEKIEELESTNIEHLKRFIEYSKKNYPAKYYSLFIGSHGGGARSNNSVVYSDNKKKWIYNAEFTDFLEEKDSVDLLCFDACFMGNIETLYQLRSDNKAFHARYIVASPPTVWSYGFNYSGIFKRITDGKSVLESHPSVITGKNRMIYSSDELKPLDFGQIIIEEHYEYTSIETDDQVLSLYDTEKVAELKYNVDVLFVSLKDNSSDIHSMRGFDYIKQDMSLHYFDSNSIEEWIDFPYFDLYDICEKIIESKEFNSIISKNAETVITSLKDVIINSFGLSYFSKFQNNKNGLGFFFPDGSRKYDETTMWFYQNWYNANSDANYYGNLSFCKDNAKMNNNVVENYFEVLDFWFDINDDNGGLNGYKF